MNLSMKQKQTHRHRKQAYGYQKGMGGGINWEFGISRYKLVYIKLTARSYCIALGTVVNILY